MCVRTRRTINLTADKVMQYGKLTGDMNLIHFDADEARKFDYDQPIAHGMLIMMLGAEMLSSLDKKNFTLIDYEMNFLKAVFVGEKIELHTIQMMDSTRYEIEGFVEEKKVVRGKALFSRQD